MTIEQAWDLLIKKLQAWLNDLILLLPNLVVAFVVLVIFFVAAKVIRRLTARLLARISTRPALNQLLTSSIHLAVVAVGMLVALSILKLDKAVMSLLAGVGVVGLALGFAFQDIAANFMSGLLIIIQRPFRVGDIISSGSYFGLVEAINLRTTIIKSWDGQAVWMPNKQIFQDPLTNYNTYPKRRVDLGVGVSYGDDLEKVREITIRTVEKLPARVDDVELYYTEFGDSSINFEVRFWLADSLQSTYAAARSDAIIAIKKAFDEHDITIPFPIRTLDFGIKGGQTLGEMTPHVRVAQG